MKHYVIIHHWVLQCLLHVLLSLLQVCSCRNHQQTPVGLIPRCSRHSVVSCVIGHTRQLICWRQNGVILSKGCPPPDTCKATVGRDQMGGRAPTVALHVSGGGQPLATITPSWCQRTSWRVCPITHETTECLLQQTITPTGVRWLLRQLHTCKRDNRTCTRHCNTQSDVLWHNVSSNLVYIEMNCASLSVVLVIEE